MHQKTFNLQKYLNVSNYVNTNINNKNKMYNTLYKSTI